MPVEHVIEEDAIELMFLEQQGDDPFTLTAEGEAQANAVATRIARFIAAARSTLDVAIYDCRLRAEPASIIAEAIKGRFQEGVKVRIAYDAATNPDAASPATQVPVALEADRKAPGTEDFLSSFAGVAEVKAITGFRVLMHNKYIVRDAGTRDAATFTGSANFTNDSWSLQENNLLFVRSKELSECYAREFAELWVSGKIKEFPGKKSVTGLQISGIPVAVGFTPDESLAVLKEIVGTIAGAQKRLMVASVVLSSGPILAALSEAIDRGIVLEGLYDGPQMDQVERQWRAAHVGADKINTWQKVAARLTRKNSIPYNRDKPHQPHNFMHNKIVMADDTVITGSFNLSNHAMGNAENVLLIAASAIARKYESYLGGLVRRYSAA